MLVSIVTGSRTSACGYRRRVPTSRAIEIPRVNTMKRFAGMIALGLPKLARVLARLIRAPRLFAARTALVAAHESAAEEALPGFEPDVLLPLQFYENLRRTHQLEGEKLLMFAILEDAVESYMKYLHAATRPKQRRFREAEDWIERRDKRWLFSFDNVCEALNIDPEYMRRGLHRWKENQLRHPEPTRTSVT